MYSINIIMTHGQNVYIKNLSKDEAERLVNILKVRLENQHNENIFFDFSSYCHVDEKWLVNIRYVSEIKILREE